MCLYSQSVPTELQEQLLSLPYWIQVYCPQQVSQSEDEQLCKFPRNGVTHIQKCACRQSNIFYSPLLYCHVGSFCKSAAPSKLGAHMAATNGNRAGWCGFWWNNGCGLLRSDWISFQIPILFSSPRLFYIMKHVFSAHPVINVPEREQVMDPPWISDKITVVSPPPLPSLSPTQHTSLGLHLQILLQIFLLHLRAPISAQWTGQAAWGRGWQQRRERERECRRGEVI